jgi:hypothetical protein
MSIILDNMSIVISIFGHGGELILFNDKEYINETQPKAMYSKLYLESDSESSLELEQHEVHVLPLNSTYLDDDMSMSMSIYTMPQTLTKDVTMVSCVGELGYLNVGNLNHLKIIFKIQSEKQEIQTCEQYMLDLASEKKKRAVNLMYDMFYTKYWNKFESYYRPSYEKVCKTYQPKIEKIFKLCDKHKLISNQMGIHIIKHENCPKVFEDFEEFNQNILDITILEKLKKINLQTANIINEIISQNINEPKISFIFLSQIIKLFKSMGFQNVNIVDYSCRGSAHDSDCEHLNISPQIIKTAKIFGIPEYYKEKDYIYYLIHKTIQHAPIDILDYTF